MTAAKRVPSDPVELVRSDLRGSWLLLTPILAVGAAVGAATGPKAVVVWLTATVSAFGLVAVLAVRRIAGRNAIFFDDEGLIVVTRGRAERAVGWQSATAARWHGGSFWTGWDPGCLLVNVNDERAPLVVGSIVIADPARRAEAGQRVEAVVARLVRVKRPAGD